MIPDPDSSLDAGASDAEVANALERLLELADSLHELELDDTEPAGDPPRWE